MHHSQFKLNGLKAALCAVTLSLTGVATAQAVFIPKPAPHNAQGQEAGGSTDISGDFSLMGAQMLGERREDSGGAYLFENGNWHERQTFQIIGGATIEHQSFSRNSWGGVIPGSVTQCDFTREQVKGSYLGDEVALSPQWVALSGYDMGHNFLPPHQSANCAGQSGKVPAVFLAKRNPSTQNKPYGSLDYGFNVPFRERVFSMDISDTDLVMVGAGGGAYVYSYDENTDEWSYNTTLVAYGNLNTESGQIVSIDGNHIVVGDSNDNEIYVYEKQGTSWSRVLKYTSTSNPGFGRAVDITGDLIAVAGGGGADFFRLNGSSLDYINSVSEAPVKLVAINGEYAVAIEEGQEDFIWQYHFSPAEGGYYRSGTLGLVGTPWSANNLHMDGLRVVSGYKGWNRGPDILTGAMIWDSIYPLFTQPTTVDNAEVHRIWKNNGEFNWRRHQGGTVSGNTGPTGGSGNSNNYYYVETSRWQGAYYSGETAVLESDYVAPQGTLSFQFHMRGDRMGKLYVEVFDQEEWREALLIDGQDLANLSSNWQYRSIDLDSYLGYVRLRFRYVAHGGYQGDVGLDSIVISQN